MKFVDEAVIEVAAGKGGDGCVSFHRGPNLPKGGPDGGDGGRGGDVRLVGDAALNTLVDFRFMPQCRAQSGRAGGGRGKTGASGAVLDVRVPVGTAIIDEETGTTIGDVTAPDQVVTVAEGGARGFGNAHFKSSTNRAPRKTTPGSPGESRRLRLTLNVIADVGLLGMPNAGKSTLISRVSASQPKIADYPFTTRVPNLGVVRVGDDASFVMADVPGLIPGASRGAGLGYRFLKHLSRTQLLLHLVDASPSDGSDPVANCRQIEKELHAYSRAFRDLDVWTVATKMDLPGADRAWPRLEKAYPDRPRFAVSAVTGLGIDDLIRAVMAWVSRYRDRMRTDAGFARRERERNERVVDDVRRHATGRADAGNPRAGVRQSARRRAAATARHTMRTALADASTWVVKVGSALLTGNGRGLDEASLDAWCGQIAALLDSGKRIVLVSSGAVAEGCRRLGFDTRPATVHELQAAAAVGQSGLIEAYERAFRSRARRIALVLLTHDDLSDRERYLNARTTLATLLDLGVVPVINENDSVATEEIKLGDNDTLAGMVASLLSADVLVLLTDQDGLHESDPRREPNAPVVRQAAAADPGLDAMAGGGAGRLGRGGMVTKLAAARLAALSGAHTVIADGRTPDILGRLARGETCGTLLTADVAPLDARKRWLAGQRTKGDLVVDSGAADAIANRGVSVLPAGVTHATGTFRRGDLVRVVDPAGRAVAKGLANYDATEVRKLAGCKSTRIGAILGYVDEPELIHRDNLVLL